MSEYEGHPNKEIAAFSEGHQSFLGLSRAFDGKDKVMTEGKAGFAVETIPKTADAELELGGPKGDDVALIRPILQELCD